MTDSLEIHPEVAQLARECAILRDELAVRHAEHARLVSQEVPALRAEYQLAIGGRAYVLFCREGELRRLRRKIELMQVSLSRTEPIAIGAIEAVLNREFAEWAQRMKEMAAELAKAQHWAASPVLSAEDGAEMQRLYRLLAKRLHPDLDERARGMWPHVQDAYRRADLNALRAIRLLLDDLPQPSLPSALDRLREVRRELEEQLARLLAGIVELKAAFPLNHAEKLSDRNWVAVEQERIATELAAVEERTRQLGGMIAALMGGLANDPGTRRH